MPTPRRLPSGKWQGVVCSPVKLSSGEPKRIYKTFTLKRSAEAWMTEQEAAIDAGTWHDPRAGEVTLRAWREAWVVDRIVVPTTQDKNDSHWRNWIEPEWGGHPLSAITRADAKAWITRLRTETCPACRTAPGLTRQSRLVRHPGPTGTPCPASGKPPGLGTWTLVGAVHHLSGLLTGAVDAKKLAGNPLAGIRLPQPGRKPPFYWTEDEWSLILLELADPNALMVDLNVHTALRPGEMYGLRRRWVDTRSWLIHVVGVQTRKGWRDWPKTSRSFRAVPVPQAHRGRLAAHLAGLDLDDIVFPAPGGGFWDDRNFARRVLGPAVERAGVRRGTPYDQRHTGASWLVQRGVDLYRVQALLGHEKYETTQIYAHLRPEEFDQVTAAWEAHPIIDPRSDNPTEPRRVI